MAFSYDLDSDRGQVSLHPEIEGIFKTLMRKISWEYMVVSPPDELSRGELKPLLDGYGANGWYLSTVIEDRWVFIREKRDSN